MLVLDASDMVNVRNRQPERTFIDRIGAKLAKRGAIYTERADCCCGAIEQPDCLPRFRCHGKLVHSP